MASRRTKGKKKKAKAKRGKKQSYSLRRKILTAVGIAGLFAVLLFASMYALARIPDPNDISRVQSVRVLDREEREVGRIASEADRVSVPLEQMPEDLRNAVIATEDRRFYQHQGVSLFSIARAAIRNAVGRTVVQGGSTITQQYVKNAFVGNERSLLRKVKEAVIAVKLERQRSKDEILELYLNTIYFGRGAYGAEAAAKTYFGVSAKDLTLPQAALLAGIIQSPESYDPTRDEDAARGRRKAVLRFMVRDGAITQEQADEAADEKLGARKRRPGGRAAHFLDEVRRELEEEIGPRRLYNGGIVVRTTLDLKMQNAAERAVVAVYDKRSDPEAALVSIDPRNGAVRALVGSRNFARRPLNIATRARRQPGSTFKPAVLAAAIEEEISIRRKYPAPGTITIDTDSGPWKVSNYDKLGRGTIPLTNATEQSVNTVYAQLIMDVGPKNVENVAHRLGVRSKLDVVPSLALGTSDVTPLELTSMYATFAARGTHYEPRFVEQVRDTDGEVLFETDPIEERVMERNDADLVNHVLQGVITDGTGRAAQIGRPAAGKTGTTESFRDAWFAGYTPDLATVVWNGFPGGKKTLQDVRGINVVGGSFPAQIWQRFMSDALEGIRPTPFAKPTITGDERPGGKDDGSSSPSPSKSSSSPSPSATSLPDVDPTKDEEPEPEPSKESPKPKPSKSSSPSPSPSPSGSG